MSRLEFLPIIAWGKRADAKRIRSAAELDGKFYIATNDGAVYRYDQENETFTEMLPGELNTGGRGTERRP